MVTFTDWWGGLTWRERPTDTAARFIAERAWNAAVEECAKEADEFMDPERVENIVAAIRKLAQ